jgi:hypothetical protein
VRLRNGRASCLGFSIHPSSSGPSLPGCGAKRPCRSNGLRRGCRSTRPKGPSPCSLNWLRDKTNAKPQTPSNPAPSSNSNLRADPLYGIPADRKMRDKKIKRNSIFLSPMFLSAFHYSVWLCRAVFCVIKPLDFRWLELSEIASVAQLRPRRAPAKAASAEPVKDARETHGTLDGHSLHTTTRRGYCACPVRRACVFEPDESHEHGGQQTDRARCCMTRS